jgi:hypothetical protein
VRDAPGVGHEPPQRKSGIFESGETRMFNSNPCGAGAALLSRATRHALREARIRSNRAGWIALAGIASLASAQPSFAASSLRTGSLHGGDGSEGVVLEGIQRYDNSGGSISSLGDINGDGVDDVIIGAWPADPNGREVAGESYVVFGRTTPFPATIPLRTLLPAGGGDGSVGFVLKGIDPSDESGYSVSGAGDVNGDGLEDLIIGAWLAGPGGRSYAGESYVVFGRSTGFPASFALGRLLPGGGGDGSEGFVLRGVSANDQSGFSVSGAGDVNGDGIDDVIVGARYPAFYAGESYVVFGRTTGFPANLDLLTLLPGGGGDGTAGFVVRGVRPGDGAGTAVSGAGDVNGDGIDDLVIGAPYAYRNGGFKGESYVVFGRATAFPAVLELRSLLPDGGGDGSAGFVLTGVDEGDSSGRAVSGAGDVNGDGADDIIIGAWSADPNGDNRAGESYVVFGSSTGFPAVIALASLFPGGGGDGSTGFVLKGIDAEDVSGWRVSGAGDLNGDGIEDLVIGAYKADPAGRSDAGESYVVFGRTSGFPAAFALERLLPGGGGDGSEGFVLRGIAQLDFSGRAVSDAGDVNGDGIADLLVSAIVADPNGQAGSGETIWSSGARRASPQRSS